MDQRYKFSSTVWIVTALISVLLLAIKIGGINKEIAEMKRKTCNCGAAK